MAIYSKKLDGRIAACGAISWRGSGYVTARMTWQSIAAMASTYAPGLDQWAVPETLWLAVWGIGLIDLAFAARIRLWRRDDANERLYRRSHRRGLHDAPSGGRTRRCD
jgi:hypothetical protein